MSPPRSRMPPSTRDPRRRRRRPCVHRACVRAASVSVLSVRKERVPSADQRAEVGGPRVESGVLLRRGLVVHS